jgi:D-tyrosyl-tRNA(Tyr) deacylase
MDIQGEVLVVSQFTLCADLKRGTRPSFIGAASPEQACRLYELFALKTSTALGRTVPTGRFGAEMQVELVNDGPVTLWITGP